MLFVIIFFLPIVFTLSYFIWWLIYRKAFKSQKKVSKILVFIGGIGLITFYYTPYSYYLEPSYHEFKKMCKLNELPNNEEKYNKILSYFGLSLDTLDWEELNRRAYKLGKEASLYLHNYREYSVYIGEIKKSRYSVNLNLYSYQNNFSKNNITSAIILGTWKTKRYNLETKGMASYELEWQEKELSCSLDFGINLRSEL